MPVLNDNNTRTHALLHAAWGQAKASSFYEKEVWRQLDKAIDGLKRLPPLGAERPPKKPTLIDRNTPLGRIFYEAWKQGQESPEFERDTWDELGGLLHILNKRQDSESAGPTAFQRITIDVPADMRLGSNAIKRINEAIALSGLEGCRVEIVHGAAPPKTKKPQLTDDEMHQLVGEMNSWMADGQKILGRFNNESTRRQPGVEMEARQVPQGCYFRKRTGEVLYMRISDSAAKHCMKDPSLVYGIADYGNMTDMKPDKKVIAIPPPDWKQDHSWRELMVELGYLDADFDEDDFEDK